MYKFIHKNIVFQSLLLVGLLVVAFSKIISASSFHAPGDMPITFLWPTFLQFENLLVAKISVAVLLLLQLSLLVFGFRRNDFSDTRTLYPAIFYLAACLCVHNLSFFSLPFFVNLFIIILLLLNINYSSSSIKNRVFLSGIIIGVLVMVEPFAGLLLVFVISSLIVNKFSSAKDIFVTLFGFSIPIIYLLSYCFMSDRLSMVSSLFSDFRLLTLFQTNHSPLDITTIISIILLLLYLFFHLRIVFSNKLIVMRRRLLTLDLLVLILFVIFIFTAHSYPVSLIYILVPLSYYFSLITSFKSNWIFHDVLIVVVLVLLFL